MNETVNNKSLRCLVVDDEPTAREGIVDLIDNVDFLNVAGTCSSAMEAATVLQKGDIDLLFLDINMPHLSGLDLLESLEDPPLTILTTAYSEYALEGYRLQVVDYLLKPISFKRFYQAVLKAQDTFNTRELAQNTSIENKNAFLYVRQSDGFQKIDWKDILYVEGLENYVKMHFKDKQLIVHQTMNSIEESLPKDAFFRVHKSYLVNVNHIDSINGTRVFIDSHELPISRHRKDELLNTVVYKNLISK